MSVHAMPTKVCPNRGHSVQLLFPTHHATRPLHLLRTSLPHCYSHLHLPLLSLAAFSITIPQQTASPPSQFIASFSPTPCHTSKPLPPFTDSDHGLPHSSSHHTTVVQSSTDIALQNSVPQSNSLHFTSPQPTSQLLYHRPLLRQSTNPSPTTAQLHHRLDLIHFSDNITNPVLSYALLCPSTSTSSGSDNSVFPLQQTVASIQSSTVPPVTVQPSPPYLCHPSVLPSSHPDSSIHQSPRYQADCVITHRYSTNTNPFTGTTAAARHHVQTAIQQCAFLTNTNSYLDARQSLRYSFSRRTTPSLSPHSGQPVLPHNHQPTTSTVGRHRTRPSGRHPPVLLTQTEHCTYFGSTQRSGVHHHELN